MLIELGREKKGGNATKAVSVSLQIMLTSNKKDPKAKEAYIEINNQQMGLSGPI